MIFRQSFLQLGFTFVCLQFLAGCSGVDFALTPGSSQERESLCGSLKDQTTIPRITSPAPDHYVQSTVHLEGTCENGIPVVISGPELTQPVMTSCNGGKFSTEVTFKPGEGMRNLLVSQDGVKDQAKQCLYVDNTAPAVFIVPGNTWRNDNTITVGGTCENGSNVEVGQSGQPGSTITTTCEDGHFSAVIDTTPGDGGKNIIASQTDQAGNRGSDDETYNVDTVPPRVTITTPLAGATVRADTVVTGTCESDLPVTLTGNAVSVPVRVTCVNGSYSSPVLLAAVDGERTIVAEQTDLAGNRGSAERNVIRDTTPPLITISQPAAGTVGRTGLSVSGECTTGLNVQISGPGVNASSSVACPSGTWTSNITFSDGDGTKTVVASQTDAAGNVGTALRNFMRDTTAPTVHITSPLAGTQTRSTIALSGTCSKEFPVILSGGITAATNVTCTNAGTFSATLTLKAPDGSKTITATQTDNVGNSSSDSRAFELITTGPMIQITGPAENSVTRNTLTLTGTCVTGLAVQISGGVTAPVSIACHAGGFTSVITLKNPDGTKNVVASQTDGVGNVGTDNRNFILDTTAPLVRITSPAEGVVAQTGVQLEGTCSDGLPVQISGAGVLSATQATCTGGSFNTPITFSAGDGGKNVVASQTDSAGNVGSDDRDFIRDTTAPVVRISTPAAGTVTRSVIALTGTCTTGLTVQISGDISAPLTANCTNSQFTASVSLSGTDGSKNIRVAQTDSVGNEGSDIRSFMLDTAAPSIQITAPAENTVTRSSLTVSGTCTNGLPVTLSGGVAAPVTAACSGSLFSATLTLTGADGTKTVIASQTDSVGNVGSDERDFLLDTTAPVIHITSPAANTVTQSTIALSGTCTAGLTVNLTGAITAAATTTCASGTFTATVTLSGADGSKTVLAAQTDAAGNTGSDSRAFILDTEAPAIQISSPAANTATRSTIALSGTCTTGLNVALSGAISAPTSVPCASGQFSATITLTGNDGIKNVVATQTDAIGNSGSDNRNFVLDTTPPNIQINQPQAGTVTRSTIALSGTCTAGLPVSINGGSQAVTATCTSGQFSATVTLSGADGTKTLTASQTDSVGNVGSSQRDFVLDTTAPTIDIVAPAENTVTRSTIALSGTCTTGLAVQITGAITSPISTSCAAGTFAATVTLNGADGSKNVVASQTDTAGNTGTDNRNFILDTTAPEIEILQPAANTLTRAVIALSGTCTTGLEVNIIGGIAQPVTATCSSGRFSADVTLSGADGAKNVIASQTDSVGNVGSDSRSFILDTTPPAIRITGPAANTLTRSGLVLTGTCITGLPVSISGDVQTATTVACSAGQFNAQVAFASPDGPKTVSVAQTDAVGNSGSDQRAFLYDGTAPLVHITSPAAGTLAQTGVTVSGTCETGLQVVLSGSGVNSTVNSSCTSGQFTAAIIFSPGEGSKNVVASQTDAAGNVGSDNRNFVRDTLAPVITITSPAENTVTRGEIQLAGTCTNGLAIEIDGDVTPAMAVCTSGQYTALIQLLPPDGSRYVNVRQTDSVGNVGSASRGFQLDTAPPVIHITGPAANSVTRTGISLTGTCTTGLSIQVSGAVSSPNNAGCSAGTFSIPLTFTTGDGVKSVVVSQTDDVGNSASDNRDFVLDTTAPLVRITSPAAGTVAKNGLTVSGTCTTGLQVMLAGAGIGTPGPVSCNAGTFSAAISFSAGDGTKTITASQTDSAGNTGSDTRDFVRDTTPPSIQITQPASGFATRAGLTVVGTCQSGLDVSVTGTGISSPSTVSCTNGAFTASVTFVAPDGTKNVVATQTDLAGNVGTDNRNFTLDTAAPLVTITSPAAGALIGRSFTLTGTCETGLALNFSGDIDSAPSLTCAGGTFSTGLFATIGNGNKTVTVSQTDAVGNSGSASRTFSLSSRPTATENFVADNSESKVDILFVDDNSASMEFEQRALGQKFPSLVTQLAGLDWQIGVTTTDCSTGAYGICGSLLPMTGTSTHVLTPQITGYEQVFLNTIERPETVDCARRGLCPSGLEEALKAAKTSVDKRNGDNAGFFRSNAAFAVIVLTDEDEQSIGSATATKPQEVIDHVMATFGADKKFKSYAITILNGDTACLKTQRDQQNGIGAYGTYAMDLARRSGGQSVSICAPDYGVTLKQIGDDLRKVTGAVKLTRVPIASSVSVRFTPAHNSTWTVQDDVVLFNTPVPGGTAIEVTYEY
jgi:hypothetical protein